MTTTSHYPVLGGGYFYEEVTNMYTYLVVFSCLVMAEPFFEHIKADSLSEAWHKAYKMSAERRELGTGDFEIYRLMTEEDYNAEDWSK